MIPIICIQIFSESTVHNDEHRAYGTLGREGFIYESICHKLRFVDYENQFHTQHFESMNTLIKREIKKRCGIKTEKNRNSLTVSVFSLIIKIILYFQTGIIKNLICLYFLFNNIFYLFYLIYFNIFPLKIVGKISPWEANFACAPKILTKFSLDIFGLYGVTTNLHPFIINNRFEHDLQKYPF